MLLLKALIDPSTSLSFTDHEWELCLCQGRHTRLSGRLAHLLTENQLIEEIPARVCTHLRSELVVARGHERSVRWEVSRLERALADLEGPVVLLKGGAYLMASLPPARGRLFSDLDILVSKNQIGKAESCLLGNGWVHVKMNPYDQRYFRTWMHELPPLQHAERKTMVDVHHALLPEAGRLHPDSALLIESAVSLPGSRFMVLAPADMVLHSAAHMFQDGDLAGSLRDLLDLDDLLRYFGAQGDFWANLVPRGRQLDLARPLFYALRYTEQILGMPVPGFVSQAARDAAQPPFPILRVMDDLVHRALILGSPDQNRLSSGLAHLLLYIRSHWLRMPPLLLAQHLLRKSLPRRSPPTPL